MGIKNDTFAGRKIFPGDVAQVNLKVSETVTHQPARIPVTVVRGTEDGPTVFVTAAVHGDEINGVAIVRQLLDVIEPEGLRGTLIGVPVVNRFGFTSQDRYLPDRRDLNRYFPGDRGGSMASRIADRIYKHVIKISDAGIDLHTAASGQSNLCHIRGDAENDEVRDLMRAFGTPIMMHSAGPKGSLRRAATEAGVPTIIFEAGEPGRFQAHAAEIGYHGTLRVMNHLGMIRKRPRKTGLQILVRRSEWVRADHGGILDLVVEPGDLVQKNQRIGIVHDPFGRHVDEIRSSHSGVVLSTATTPLTNPGNAVVHIGYLHKTLQKARRYVRQGGDLGHVNWIEARKEFFAKQAKRRKTEVARKAKAAGKKKSGTATGIAAKKKATKRSKAVAGKKATPTKKTPAKKKATKKSSKASASKPKTPAKKRKREASASP